MKRVLLSLLLLLLSVAAGAAMPFSVSGKVTDARDGTPLEGAVISLEGLWAVSGEDGGFTLTRVQPGTYSLKVSLLGYVDLERSVKVDRDIAGLTLDDIQLIELNEAFASQSLACIDELGLNTEIVNVNGGGIAFGHPLGCTGAYLTIKLLGELRRRGQSRGLVSMCIGGGMGAAGIFEMIE